MWRILNKLLGWQYVTYMYGSSMSVGRVKMMGDTMYVHECCNGYKLIEKFGAPIHALTMTYDELEEMKKHNTNKERNNGNNSN